MSLRMTISEAAISACLLEVTAPKPGNVHRAADFPQMTLVDMCLSAVAIGAPIAMAPTCGVGASVLSSVTATRQWVHKNTNLGIILLFAPLACAKRGSHGDVKEVLATLTPQDARDVYSAIRMAMPGGLGRVAVHDVYEAAPDNLLDAMRAAASRDSVARQYATDFRDVREFIVPRLEQCLEQSIDLPLAIVHTHVQTLAQFPDSLIARKRSWKVALQASLWAEQVLAAGEPHSPAYQVALAALDFWLRSDGNARNPGTTADLVAAALFILLLDNKLTYDHLGSMRELAMPTRNNV